MSRRIVILTWVSWSWKTSVQEELLKRWWVRPINFSTRRARSSNPYKVDNEWDYSSEELWEYVFLNRTTFAKKLINWDFIESTQYWWNLYWVSKHSFLEHSNNNLVVILDPVWRAQVMEVLTRLWIEYETYYFNINEETQVNRFRNRWDSSEEISKRKKDFNWFHPTNKCKVLNWNLSIETLANIIERG